MTGSARADQTPSPLPDDAFLEEPAPRKPRRRQLVIVLLATFGVLGGLCLVGCLVIGALTSARRVTAPAEVLQVAHEIVPITVPAGYSGELAEVAETPLVSVRKVIFRHESGKGIISLVEVKLPFQLGDQEAEVRQQMFDSFVNDMRQIITTDESSREITIRDQPAEFHGRAGRDALSSTQLHEVRGVFAGAQGMAQLWLQAEDSVWDEAAVDQLLNGLGH